MIVVDKQQDIRAFVGKPGGQRREVLEDGRPHRIVALVTVVREANGRRVRRGEAADDACHDLLLRTVTSLVAVCADSLVPSGRGEILPRRSPGARGDQPGTHCAQRQLQRPVTPPMLKRPAPSIATAMAAVRYIA